MDSIFFTNPILWISYSVALFLCLFDLRHKTKGILSDISMLIVVCTTAYALLCGAGLLEAAFVIMCFLALNLRKGEGKE